MQPLEMAQEFVAYSKNKSKGLSKTLLAAGAVLVLVIFALSGQSPGSGSSANTFQPGPPIAALAPPGECAFGEDWSPAPLVERRKVSDDAVLLRFGLADGRSLGLSTCACLLAQGRASCGPTRPYPRTP